MWLFLFLSLYFHTLFPWSPVLVCYRSLHFFFFEAPLFFKSCALVVKLKITSARRLQSTFLSTFCTLLYLSSCLNFKITELTSTQRNWSIPIDKREGKKKCVNGEWVNDDGKNDICGNLLLFSLLHSWWQCTKMWTIPMCSHISSWKAPSITSTNFSSVLLFFFFLTHRETPSTKCFSFCFPSSFLFFFLLRYKEPFSSVFFFFTPLSPSASFTCFPRHSALSREHRAYCLVTLSTSFR